MKPGDVVRMSNVDNDHGVYDKCEFGPGSGFIYELAGVGFISKDEVMYVLSVLQDNERSSLDLVPADWSLRGNVAVLLTNEPSIVYCRCRKLERVGVSG